jgi:uncharacterized protein YbbK (DUF523 family)
MISSPTVANLMEYVDFLPVCPKVELELGIPRDPVRIVLENGEQRFVQSASGRDVPEVMEAFCTDFLNSTGDIDSFILKYRSLMNQTSFDPFPEGLLEVNHVDSHLREDLWK